MPLAVFFVSAWLVGARLHHVRTGSMAPTHPVGSLAVSTPIDASQVELGMAITFVDPVERRRLVTHRVVRIERDIDGQVSFVTKGDANRHVDAVPVDPGDVQSRVRWSVPHLGRLLAGLRGPVGWAVLLGIPFVMWASGEWQDRHSTRRAGWRGPVDVARRPAPSGGSKRAACATCRGVVGRADRFCRHCGARHGPVRTPVPDRARAGRATRPRPAGAPAELSPLA